MSMRVCTGMKSSPGERHSELIVPASSGRWNGACTFTSMLWTAALAIPSNIFSMRARCLIIASAELRGGPATDLASAVYAAWSGAA